MELIYMDLLPGFMPYSVSRRYFTSLPQPVIENKSPQIILQVLVAWMCGQHLKRKVVFPGGSGGERELSDLAINALTHFYSKGRGQDSPLHAGGTYIMHRLRAEARNVGWAALYACILSNVA